MKFIQLSVLFGVLLSLSACGDGWEIQHRSDVFPYGNERTAGEAVVYVRKKLMPAREIVLERPERLRTPVIQQPAPELVQEIVEQSSEIEDTFTNSLTK